MSTYRSASSNIRCDESTVNTHHARGFQLCDGIERRFHAFEHEIILRDAPLLDLGQVRFAHLKHARDALAFGNQLS